MGCLDVRDMWGGKKDMESNGEAPPTGDILINIEVVHASHLLCGTLVGLHMWRGGW